MEDESGQDLLNSLNGQDGTHLLNNEEEERRRKSMTHGRLVSGDQVVEVVRLTGNFWKNHGFSRGSINYLYPEEALYLFEKNRVYVEYDGRFLDQQALYDLTLQAIPHECYLTYLRLKALGYIVFRHTTSVRSFHDDNDVCDYLCGHPTATLLDSLVSYKIYAYDSTLIKRKLAEAVPTGYVVVLTGSEVLSARIVLTLLAEAGGVPVIFAILLPSGNVVLEEFTDAVTSLTWKKAPLAAAESSTEMETDTA